MLTEGLMLLPSAYFNSSQFQVPRHLTLVLLMGLIFVKLEPNVLSYSCVTSEVLAGILERAYHITVLLKLQGVSQIGVSCICLRSSKAPLKLKLSEIICDEA